jgi:hypothetical protein
MMKLFIGNQIIKFWKLIFFIKLNLYKIFPSLINNKLNKFKLMINFKKCLHTVVDKIDLFGASFCDFKNKNNTIHSYISVFYSIITYILMITLFIIKII